MGQVSGLDAIYIFVDEFSDLTDDEQEKFSNLLKKLLGSKNNVFFKVGTITDRFYFGKDIIIGRDIYPIYLDLSDFVRFIYDSVFQAYDCYFLKDRIKSYKCPVCNRIYDEKEVAQVKVKRCFECDEKLEEIIHKDVPISDGNYTEVEVKILGIIATLSKEDAMSAAEISAAVGCNIQKVAIWGSKVLAKKGLINIEKREARNYYYDKVD